MNKVILMGRLTKNPEIKYAGKDNDMAVARYTLAVNRRYKRDGEQEADFISCVTFGKSAEFAQKYLRKGMRIVIGGRISTGNYKDKDGKTVYSVSVPSNCTAELVLPNGENHTLEAGIHCFETTD